MRISDWSSDVCSSDLSHPRWRTFHDAIRTSARATEVENRMVRTVARRRIRRTGDLLRYACILGDPVGSCQHYAATRAPRPIGRAHVRTPVTNAHIVCRLPLENKQTSISSYMQKNYTMSY